MAKQLTLIEIENTGDAPHIIHDAHNLPVTLPIGAKKQLTVTSKIAARYRFAHDKGGPMKVLSYVPLDIDDGDDEGTPTPKPTEGRTVERVPPNLANPRGANKASGGKKPTKASKAKPRVRLTKAEERAAEKRTAAEETKTKAKAETKPVTTLTPRPGILNEGEPTSVTELLSRASEFTYQDMLRIARALLPDDQLPDPRPSMPAIMKALRSNGNPQ